MRERRLLIALVLLITAATNAVLSVNLLCATDNKFATLSNAQAQEMLAKIQEDIQQYYYDPALHGLDLNKRFNEASQKIAAAKSQDEALLIISAAVAALNDSHTRFRPPVRPYGVDYGWLMEAVGDSNCYVTAVRSDSDAAAKGMKPGDQVLAVNGVPLLRNDISTIEYSYHVFPQSGFHLDVRSPDGVERTIVAKAKIIPGQAMVTHTDVLTWARAHRNDRPQDRSRYHELNKKVLVWKLPDFVIDPSDVDGRANKMRAYETVVLDLRGNPGGRIDALEKFIGAFFDHDVKVGDRKDRAELKPQIAKTRGGKAFTGKLIVLVDSTSTSAAEVFARVVQLEKRGIVLGDRSGGAVMEGKLYIHALYLDRFNVTQYGAMITVANLTMTDGKSLENVGVMPDERILPTPADIAVGRDPVLARAAQLSGVELTSDEARKIFPFEWPKEQMPEID
jgi:carboxyl-terminal processing protease